MVFPATLLSLLEKKQKLFAFALFFFFSASLNDVENDP